jgi:hypothetical protein
MRVVLAVVLACALTADLSAQLRARLYASGFTSPVAIVQDPTDTAVQFVVQQGGRIRSVRAGTVGATDFLDISGAVQAGGEQGLLGLAFAPDYATSRRFFVNFTNRQGHTVVSRFRRSDNPLVADAGSRFDLRWNGAAGEPLINQPFSNHNISMSGSATAGPATTPNIGRRIPTSCSARCCAWTSASRTTIRSGIGFPRTIRSW